MFWGLIMEPERRYTQKVKKSFHVSMAALDVGSSSSEPSQVMCGYEGRNYLLCTLKQPDMLQCALDLEFSAGSEVSFASNGKAHIHLTGYLTEVNEDELSNLDDLEEGEDGYLEEKPFKEITLGKKKMKTELKSEPSPKKPKLLNGSVKKTDDEVEEEESDDPDYEEDEADSEGNEEVEDEDNDDDDEEEEEDDDEEEDEEEAEIQQKTSKNEKKTSKKLEASGHKEKKVEQSHKKQKKILKGGVQVEDLIEGSGPPAKIGRFVNVYYEGRLEKNNKLFDSTNKGPGFKFRLGSGEVIKAWDIGIVGMKVGGVRKIVCPPNTAYGAQGSPPAIPPHSTLVFTVTLKKVQ